MVDSPKSQHPIQGDPAAGHRVGGTNNRGVDDARNGRGAFSSLNNRGGGDTRKSNDARKRGSQQHRQQPGRPQRLARTYSHDPPEFSSEKTDQAPAVLNLSPPGIESTPSQGSSIRRKGEHATLMAMSCS